MALNSRNELSPSAVDISCDNDSLIVAISGKHTAKVADIFWEEEINPKFDAFISSEVSIGKVENVILDFSNLEFLDKEGFNPLVKHIMKKGFKCTIKNPNERMSRLIEKSQLLTLGEEKFVVTSSPNASQDLVETLQ